MTRPLNICSEFYNYISLKITTIVNVVYMSFYPYLAFVDIFVLFVRKFDIIDDVRM